MASQQMPRSRQPQPKAISSLLESYSTTHPLRSPSPLPASSRVDPSLPQRLPPPTSSSPLLWTIPTWIAFIQFALAKGIHIIWSLIKHALVGPARKSWGYRMTFIVSFMRNVAQHTSLADIVLIRRLISLHSIIPLPADAVVTPITFVVPRQAGQDIARGFLQEWDIKETGTRELTGEWVVGTDVWKRLKTARRSRNEEKRKNSRPSPYRGGQGSEMAINGLGPVKGNRTTGRDSPDVDTDTESQLGKKDGAEKVIYYVHGGAYYVGNAATHRLVTIGVSKACNARVFAITYRLAPENVFPLPLHDVLHGYLRLLAPPLSIAPENIIIAGDSAGGGLSLALCMYLRDEGYKLPAGLVLMSPWVDLTMSCGSWDDNADSDVVPRPDADDHLNPVGCYLGPEGISTYLTHPYASPLFGDFHDLPPMLIQSGDSEVLRDENTLLAHKATLAGVNVTHELYEDMIHVFQMFTWLPTAKAAINSVGRWVRSTLPKIEEEMRAQGVEMNEGRVPSPMAASSGSFMASESRMVDVDGREVNASGSRRARALERTRDALHLSLPEGDIGYQQSTIEPTTLPRRDSGSSSGSPTPTNSRSRSPALSSSALSPPPNVHRDPFFSQQTRPPVLRRANTHHNGIDTPISNSATSIRRRRPTVSSASIHASSPTTSVHGYSNPVSPTPSVRRHLRSPSGASQQLMRTRTRSESHSDINSLVEGYVEGGAANETVVYGAGGDVISVGVLGEEEEQ